MHLSRNNYKQVSKYLATGYPKKQISQFHISQIFFAIRSGHPPPGELYWTHHWQKNCTIPEMSTKQTVERWEDEDKFPEDNVSDTSSRDYPRLYLESDYGQRTDREMDLDTDLERAEKERERRINSR